MSNVIDISEARQKRRFPPLQIVHSRPEIELILEDARKFARILAEMRDSEPPEPAA